ncbi:hypothetical protein MG293_001137 [Ovis ammon polii]|uniref:G-protein coupled receptors family 1 profile domain-containing protein n=1 Tax=Ovis ammon polii TaxID=230172 RepID=A0AAD4ULN3_OVIAM|nr:hypothetical protein MG293_001137 [Ovis ammon polii]
MFIIVGNFMIFFAVQLDARLHNPMYNFISIFSFLEIWYTTVTIPKMLSNLVSKEKTISFIGCLLQMYFFHSLGVTEALVLTVMAIDSVTLMYLRFSVTFPPLLDKAIALMFAVLAPLFNPIIYSLRNKDMKDAIKKVLCSWGFTGGPMVKNPPCNARDTDSTPGPGRSHTPWSN